MLPDLAARLAGLWTEPVGRGTSCQTWGMAAERFLTLADVAEVLNISASQTYALVRSGELEGIKIGGRGQWRVERARLENFIERMYEQTRDFVSTHPLVEAESGH